MGDTVGDIWTIGHWTCPEETFLATLEPAGIDVVADVRAQPGSRRSPQFSIDVMPVWLADAGIDYVHLPDLGGRRRRQPVEPEVNGGWQNQSFHNYADYTLSAPFAEALADLECRATARRLVLLCGEPMPWRCHRLLLANLLVTRGWCVRHLMTGATPRQHELGQWGAAPVIGADGAVTYPEPAP